MLVFSRCSPPRRLAGGAGAFDGRGAQTFGGKRKFLCPARKSLFFHKMNEGIFGNIWRKGAQIWKCLAWACKGLHGPRAGEGDGALSRARAPRIARATRTIRTEALSRRRFRSSWSASPTRRSNGSPRAFPTRGDAHAAGRLRIRPTVRAGRRPLRRLMAPESFLRRRERALGADGRSRARRLSPRSRKQTILNYSRLSRDAIR